MRFAKLNCGARGAELIVEVMDRREVLLADVAVNGLAQLTGVRLAVHTRVIEARGRKDVRRGEHRLAAQLPDAGFGVDAVLVAHDRRFLLLDGFLAQATTRIDVGAEDDADRVDQTLAIFGRDAREHAAIGADLFEERGGVAQPRDEGVVRNELW